MKAPLCGPCIRVYIYIYREREIYICVCIYIYIYVSLSLYIYIYIYVYVYIYIYDYISLSLSIYIYIYIYVLLCDPPTRHASCCGLLFLRLASNTNIILYCIKCYHIMTYYYICTVILLYILCFRFALSARFRAMFPAHVHAYCGIRIAPVVSPNGSM